MLISEPLLASFHVLGSHEKKQMTSRRCRGECWISDIARYDTFKVNIFAMDMESPPVADKAPLLVIDNNKTVVKRDLNVQDDGKY